MPKPVYVTTPIYYVNDRPHIGHCYTTCVADCLARAERAIGGSSGAFLLTGTDEHADKVVTSAREHQMSPIAWADKNAAEFRAAFDFMRCAYDDFIRTTEDRHTSRVLEYIRELQRRDDVYLGEYAGWWDPSQEEYLTETAAKDAGGVSPVTGKPLVRRTERNYFFRLSKYQGALEKHIAANPSFILPEARRNEVLGRLRDGLQDIPISRPITDDPATQWGIRMPDDDSHRIYVWIDALFNYLTVVDTPEREGMWPAHTHFIAKDILWFHAVIWPCLLMALGRELPGHVYSHAYWVRDGRKMSKSLGNFVTIEVLRAYAGRFGLDALRWYLLTQGPLGATDSDFSHAKFVETYNSDLANGIGNCASRVSNMIEKYFGGRLPAADGRTRFAPPFASPTDTVFDWIPDATGHVQEAVARTRAIDVAGALHQGIALVTRVDGFINATQPFKLAKKLDEDPGHKDQLAAILYCCAEAVRVASHLLAPAMPDKMGALWKAWGCVPPDGVPLESLAAFGAAHALKPGTPIAKGEALFMRADPAEAPPA